MLRYINNDETCPTSLELRYAEAREDENIPARDVTSPHEMERGEFFHIREADGAWQSRSAVAGRRTHKRAS